MQNFNDPSINYLGWCCMYTHFSLVKNLTSCLLFVFAYLLVHSLRIFTFHLLLFQVIRFSFFLRRKGQIGKVEVHSIPPQMSLQVSLSLITPHSDHCDHSDHSDHCTLSCNHCDHCDYCTLTVITVITDHCTHTHGNDYFHCGQSNHCTLSLWSL